jgi:hypothetical protein
MRRMRLAYSRNEKCVFFAILCCYMSSVLGKLITPHVHEATPFVDSVVSIWHLISELLNIHAPQALTASKTLWMWVIQRWHGLVILFLCDNGVIIADVLCITFLAIVIQYCWLYHSHGRNWYLLYTGTGLQHVTLQEYENLLISNFKFMWPCIVTNP